jgi:hypothetical protein
MKKFKVRFEGVTSLLFSRMTEEDLGAIETGVKKPLVPGINPRTEAEKRLWTKDGKAGIPFHMFFACLVEAGRKVKNGRAAITGTRGTALTSFLKLNGDFYSFDNESKWEVDKRMAKQMVRGQSIARPVIRPRFDKWGFSVEGEFDEKRIAEETVKLLFEEAGRTGLGAWRPSSPKPGPFGQFKVVDWEVED